MKKEALMLLDVDLTLFDGEGGAPAAASGSQADSGVATPTGNKGTAEKVIYGKVEDETQPVGDSKAKETDQVDPSAKFEELIKGEYKEHFDKRIQSIIDKRFKEMKGLEKRLGELSPLAELLQHKYGTDNIAEIQKHLDNEIVEELAYQNNMSPENYRKVMDAEKIQKEKAMMESERQRQEQVRAALERWNIQAEEAKAEYPEFDLKSAMQDDKFVDLIKSNVPVKTAYELLNMDKIKEQMRKQTEAKTAQSIQAKQSRPQEAGLKTQSGVIVKSDVKSLTKADREDIARRAQRGESIKF